MRLPARECGRGAFLQDEIVGMLQAIGVKRLYSDVDEGAFFEDLARYGELSQSARQEIFVTAMQTIIFPGLERAGIDSSPTAQWLGLIDARFRVEASSHVSKAGQLADTEDG